CTQGLPHEMLLLYLFLGLPDQRLGLRRPTPVDLTPLLRRRRRLHRLLLRPRLCGMATWTVLRGRPSAPPTSPLRPHVVLRRLVVASTDRGASASFAHGRLASRILGLINQCAR